MTDQFLEPWIIGVLLDQASRFALGRQPGAMERLADIDIAEAGNEPLVEKGGFERRFLAAESLGQIGGVEFIAQGLDPDAGEQLVAFEPGFADEIHEAETARIGIDDAQAILAGENDVIMRTRTAVRRRTLLIELAEPGHAPLGVDDGEATRHAEMEDQDLAALEESEDVFRPPLKAKHDAALDALGEIGRKGKAQIAAGEFHFVNTLARKHGLEAAHHGFDFWKLRHGISLNQFDGKDKDYA